jgi:hypothetical protein
VAPALCRMWLLGRWVAARLPGSKVLLSIPSQGYLTYLFRVANPTLRKVRPMARDRDVMAGGWVAAWKMGWSCTFCTSVHMQVEWRIGVDTWCARWCDRVAGWQTVEDGQYMSSACMQGAHRLRNVVWKVACANCMLRTVLCVVGMLIVREVL